VSKNSPRPTARIVREDERAWARVIARASARATGPGRRLAALVVTLAVAAADPAAAQGTASLEQRVQRIERVVDSSAMIQLLENVKSLQREVRKLRGEIEVQTHTLGQLKRRQRELYADVDQRLQALESAPRGVAGAAGDGSVPGAAATSSQAQGQTGAQTASQATAETPAPAGSAEAAPTAPASGPPVDDVAEQNAYQAAFELLKDGRYEPAANAFREFLGRYPNGRYASNAQYWLGETFYGMKRFDDASREFQTLLGRYPDSPKRPHAMLKLGYSQAEMGKNEEARATLRELVKRYPGSTAAGLARKRLERLGG